MKVLLFTHSQDIDGAGCAVLLTQAFDDYKIVPTKTFEITSNVKSYINSGEINNYDKVFVTDLCIKEPVLNEIYQDEILREKIVVIDHHKTEIDEGNDKYPFVNITVSKNNIKVSGTSLFYEYLIDNNYLNPTNFLDEFTDWTRQYDIWDWKKENNYEARKLHIIFETQGYNYYMNMITNKIKTYDHVTFNEEEQNIVNDYDEQLNTCVNLALKMMQVKNLYINDSQYRIGYVKIPYKYRNDVNEFVLKDNQYDIDAVGMIMTDTETVSYRQVKNIDVSEIAKHFDGKGHREASTHLQSNSLFIDMINS